MYNQLSTYVEAAQIAKQLGSIGGGVTETYIPEYEGPFVPPSDGINQFLHFKFANGADGFNVGLIRAFMQYSPFRWPMMINSEVEAARKVPVSIIPVGSPAGTLPVVTPAYCPIDFNREVQPGIFASSAEDKEPLGAIYKEAVRTYKKIEVPNGMMSFRAWKNITK